MNQDEIISLNGISKRFGKFQALSDVTVSVSSGVTGLLGPNGAGKSTLIKILLGLLKPSSGSGSVLGFDVNKRSRLIRENVGYMPEDDCSFAGLTGIESVQTAARLSRYPKLEALRRGHEILDFCGAGQERYRQVHTYSTGMRQKLRFAMAIVHDPPLLILDEPTSGLDPEERESMLNRIRVLSRTHKKAVVICTHILPDVQAISDSVVILARGKVQVSEKLEVLARPSSPAIQVRINGTDSEVFSGRLRAAGMQVEQLENRLLSVSREPSVSTGFNSLTDAIWNIAAETQTSIRSLSPAINSLEEIFINAVKEQPDAAA